MNELEAHELIERLSEHGLVAGKEDAKRLASEWLACPQKHDDPDEQAIAQELYNGELACRSLINHMKRMGGAGATSLQFLDDDGNVWTLVLTQGSVAEDIVMAFLRGK